MDCETREVQLQYFYATLLSLLSITMRRNTKHSSTDQELPHLPFLHHRPEFVRGQVHAMEISEDMSALNLLGDQPELPEGDLIVLEVSQ